MQHIEFVHTKHFDTCYNRIYPTGKLSLFIDFIWQTKFDPLWKTNPGGFSDLLFPNIGYTYLINLGTPFHMQVNNQKVQMKQDGFLPRLNMIEAFHTEGNCLFGIKFKVSPVIFEKKVNFSEYQDRIYPLSYLIEPDLIKQVRVSATFQQRVKLISRHYEQVIEQYESSLEPIRIVTSVIDHSLRTNHFNESVEDIAMRYKISSRTLQRYFESATGVSTKKALQVLRIRKAVQHIISSPDDFHFSNYNYYDYSHFYKHLTQFLQKKGLKHLQPHLHLLKSLK